MTRHIGWHALFVGVCLAASASAPANADTTFDVKFDNTFDSTLSSPFVGTGTVHFDDTLGDGTYLLTSLTNLSISFTIGADTFTQADLVGPSPSLSITIYQSGTNFYFNGPPSVSPFGGAADFLNPLGAGLTTEPNNFGPAPYNLYVAPTAGFSGTYGVDTANSVPEPSTMVMLSTFGLVAGCVAWKRKRQIAA